MNRFFKSFILSLALFAVVFFGLKHFALNKNILKTTDGEEIETKVPGEMMVLFMGVDGTDVHQKKGLRTDTLMLGKANFETGEVELLSIPRDTRVLVKGKEDKINHAHSYGGPKLAMQTVSDFLNLDIDYYVKIDFTGVKSIVNAIGGVELDVPVNMNYNDPSAVPPLSIHLQEGRQVLDGDKAHDFLRFRSYPNGDLGRIEAQQYFMKEMAKQTLNPKNILKIDKFIKTYYEYVDTNISMGTMVKYGLSAGKLNVDEIRTERIPGEGAMIGGVSYWIYDKEETPALVEDMFGEYLRN